MSQAWEGLDGSGPDWSEFDVLVVVVTYRGGPALARCLGSLAQQRGLAAGTAPRHRVLVVDNGSSAATRSVLDPAQARGQLVVVRPGRNLGFAAGANIGLRAAVAAWSGGWQRGLVVLVNDDAVPAPDFLARLWSAHQRADPDVGALAGLLLLAGQGDTVNSSGTVVTSRGSARDRHAGRRLDGLATDVEVFGFCGGAAALRPAALADVGVFADDWFLYYEDVDLSWRLRANGWRVQLVRDAVVVHELAASSGTTSPVFRYHNDRNALTTFARHAPAGVVLRTWLRYPLAVAWHAVRPATRPLVPWRLRAGRDAMRRLPRTLRERRLLWPGGASARRAVAARWLDREA